MAQPKTVVMKENNLVSVKKEYSTDAIRKPLNDDDRVYPCMKCGILRSKNEGGTIFTVCDECWDKKK
jgi:hypothetical protein